MTEERLSSGIAGLDKMLDGGFLPVTSVLVRGAPGAGKTTLALQYLLAGAQRGEAGLFVTFEEFPKSVYRDAESLGWDLRQYEEDGRLRIMFTSPAAFLHSLQRGEGPLGDYLGQTKVKRAAVDALSHYVRLSRRPHELRRNFNVVMNSFKREGITALFLSEDSPGAQGAELGRASFVADTLIMMRYLEIDSAVQRAIFVVKTRGSDHDPFIHSYTIGQGGLKVGPPFENRRGLLSGLARRSLISTVT